MKNKTNYCCTVNCVLTAKRVSQFHFCGTRDEALLYTIKALRKLFIHKTKKLYKCKIPYVERLSNVGYVFEGGCYWNVFRVDIDLCL